MRGVGQVPTGQGEGGAVEQASCQSTDRRRVVLVHLGVHLGVPALCAEAEQCSSRCAMRTVDWRVRKYASVWVVRADWVCGRGMRTWPL